MGTILRGLLGMILLVALAAGCNRRASEESETADVGGEGSGAEEEAASEGPPEGWPRVLVVGPGAGPALYFGPEPNAPAFGYVSPGVRIRLESGVRNGRIEAVLAGPLPAKGWIPADRIAAYAQRRGRVSGTAYYLGPNDFVNVLGPADEEGQMRVAVRPWLGGGTFLEAQVGTFPADALGDREVDPASVEALTPGECYRLPAGQAVPVYDRAGGRVVASLPAGDAGTAIVLRAREPWYGVRAGYGPYVVGYVQGPLTQCDGPRPEPAPMVPTPSGEMPSWMARETGALHRVARGTRIRFNGQTVARLREEGWARELGRQEGDLVDVFVATDEGVALRGLVPASALTLVEGAPQQQAPQQQAPQQQAPQQQAPQEPVPDELSE